MLYGRDVLKLYELVDTLEDVLRRIINELPTKRDWLDPELERQAKEILKKAAKG